MKLSQQKQGFTLIGTATAAQQGRGNIMACGGKTSTKKSAWYPESSKGFTFIGTATAAQQGRGNIMACGSKTSTKKSAWYPESSKGFTLIELLVVIAIISLLSGIILAALTFARKRARDGRRIAEVSTLNKAIAMYESNAPNPSEGAANIVYTSLPDTSSTCGSWGLPALKSGWSYNCVLNTALRKTDGTGWLPINFTGTPGETYIPILPIDPINDGTSYYRYIAPLNGPSYAVGASNLEASSSLTIALGGEAGGFTMGSASTLAVATNQNLPTSYSWNGNGWYTPPATSSGGIVGTSTVYGTTGAYPYGIAFDGTNMWTANYSGNSVTKISPTGAMTTYTGGFTNPIGIAFDGTNMWVTNYGGGTVTKVTPSGATSVSGATGAGPYSIAFDGTNMWTANYSGNSVSKVTPAGVVTTYPCSCTSPMAIASDGTNMWTANNGSITKITPAGAATTYPNTYTAGNVVIAFDGTNMWSASAAYEMVSKITPSGVITTYSGMRQPTAIAFDGTNMWTGSGINGSLFKITPSGTVTEYTDPLHTDTTYAMAYDGLNMWVANQNTNTVKKILVR